MTNSQTICYQLTMGSFFEVLMKNANLLKNKRQRQEGKKENFKQCELLGDLISIFNKGFNNTFNDRSAGTITTNLRTGKKKSPLLGFNTIEDIMDVKNQMEKQYNEKLILMNEIIVKYLDENRFSLLVDMLFTLLETTNDINKIFYDNIYTEKKDLLQKKEIDLNKVLLGIWHEVVKNSRYIDIKTGADTYLAIEDDSLELNNYNIKINFSSKSNNQNNLIVNQSSQEQKKQEILEPLEFKIINYLSNLNDNYKTIKTLLYKDTPKDFYSFYVCNDLMYHQKIDYRSWRNIRIQNISINHFLTDHQYSIITGIAGLGKSMMMRHLLLDTIKKYNELNKVPLFISLKDFNDEHDNLLSFVYSKFYSFNNDFEVDDLIKLLSTNRAILLFDGYDEIKSELKDKYQNYFETFVNSYPKNTYIISSRPYSSFIAFNRFSVFDLSPFALNQANNLIIKLEFRPDEPAIKEAFLEKLNKDLYLTHKDFIKNPLLLTIMLMTFEEFADVPSKMHIFYYEAFITLAQKHDANKGAFKRQLKTKLTTSSLSEIMAEFCARTYTDEKIEFTPFQFDYYFNQLNPVKEKKIGFTSDDLKTDLVDNVCLMYYEGAKFHFTHRSFQEYFCALYFSKKKDKTLKSLIKIFDSKQTRTSTDLTFSMLYDMIPEKIEEYLFLPFLDDLFNSFKGNGLESYIKKQYPQINYLIDEVQFDIVNSPDSYILSFILNLLNVETSFPITEIEEPYDFIDHPNGYVDTSWKPEIDYPDYEVEAGELVWLDECEYDDYVRRFDPEIVGYNCSFSPIQIFNNIDEYEDIYNLLMDPEFIFNKQYTALKQYLSELKEKSFRDIDDIFDV